VFEQFAADLASRLNPSIPVRRQGSQGHTQDGLDILIEHPTGELTGIQCKRERQFGPAKVRAAIAELKLPVKECFIYLSRIASPDARQEIRKHRRWQLWDASDISQAVRHLPLDTAVRLVDAYFPRWREPFLGIAEPGPWLTRDEFFRTFTSGRIYSHEWPLVGRTDERYGLRTFAATGDTQVAAVLGRGGIGKTRLLGALAADIAQDHDTAVRFLAQNTTVRPEHFELLPSASRLLVIIDDAHERSDNAAIVAGIMRSRRQAKVLLALRPYGLGQLASDLRRIGLHPSELQTWNLDDLTVDQAKALARHALESQRNQALIQRLAAIGSDCPLIIVVAAGLIKRGALEPGNLEGTSSIRTDILEAFRDALVSDPVSADPELRRAVLHAVAILQPFRISDQEFQSTISELAGQPFDQVLPHLKSLEDGGILLRRGRSLRIVPDLLGDVVLAGAIADIESGVSTGYVERVRRATSGTALQHVLINASRVDWQVRQGQPGVVSLVESLWSAVEAGFRTSDATGRVALLKLLRKVAYFQPRRAMELARWAFQHSTTTADDADTSSYLLTSEHVLHHLPSVVENVAYDPESLPDALDLLWQLAQRDERPTNQHPEHPIRILRNLAEYRLGKSRVYSEAVIDAAEGWLTQQQDTDPPHSPFDVLEPLLATEGEDRTFDVHRVTLRSFSLNSEAVRELRSRVMDLALREARAADPRRAVRAVQAMRTALRYPSGLFGRTVTDAEREQWTPILAKEIKQLGDLGANTEQDPIVAVAIRQTVQWHARSSGGTRVAARRALQRLPRSTKHDLTLALHDGWGRILDRVDNFQNAEHDRLAYFETVAAAATSRWTDDEIVDLLTDRITVDRRTFKGSAAGNPGPFVWTLISAKPSIGRVICRRIVEDPTSVLVELVPVVLNRLLRSQPDTTMELAEDLLSTGSLPIAHHVAGAFGWARGDRDQLVDGEPDLLRSFVTHVDPVIRRLAVQAARSLSRRHRPLALELATTVRLDDDLHVAGEAVALFGPQGDLSWQDLSEQQAAALLEQLRRCISIDEDHVTDFLRHLSAAQPGRVIKLLIDRVETAERKPRRSYDPLPFTWHRPLQVRSHDLFPELLRGIRDWISDAIGSSYRRNGGSEIFRAVAQDFDAQVIDVLDEGLLTDLPQQIRTVGAILQEAPRTFVWDDVDFVIRALQAAERHGEMYVRSIGGALHQAVMTGARMGAIGEPFPEDIEQRDRSTAIARRLPRGSIEQRFYQSLVVAADNNIKWEADLDAASDGRTW